MVAKVVPVEATEENPVPVSDHKSGNLLFRILQMLMAPLGYDLSLQRYRGTVLVETLPTLANLTTLGTVTNPVPIGNVATIGSMNADMVVRAQVDAAWPISCLPSSPTSR